MLLSKHEYVHSYAQLLLVSGRAHAAALKLMDELAAIHMAPDKSGLTPDNCKCCPYAAGLNLHDMGLRPFVQQAKPAANVHPTPTDPNPCLPAPVHSDLPVQQLLVLCCTTQCC